MVLAERINILRGTMEAAYAIGGRSTEEEDMSRLIFMTPGVLLQRFKTAFQRGTYLVGEQVTHIILDEVHERTVEYDVLCSLARSLLNRNSELRIVLMSATMAVAQLQTYMSIQGLQEGSVPVVQVPRASKTRQVYYVEDVYRAVVTGLAPWEPGSVDGTASHFGESLLDIMTRPSALSSLLWGSKMKLVLSLVRWIDKRFPVQSTIMIFVSGLAQIEALDILLLGWNTICLHGATDLDLEVSRLYKAQNGDRRKVIITTNIAESSLTVPDVDHVIDTCIVKEESFDHDSMMSSLEERYCSKDSCDQRAGRTGRVRFGYVWRMISATEFQALDDTRRPGILLGSLLNSVLLVADMQVGNIKAFLQDLPSPPQVDYIDRTVFELEHHYDAVVTRVDNGFLHIVTTTKGRILAALGVDVPIGQLVLVGVMFGNAMPCVQAAAILSCRSPLVQDGKYHLLAGYDRGTSCDVVALVETYREWLRWQHSTKREQTINVLRDVAALEVREKTADLVSCLSRFGLLKCQGAVGKLRSTELWESTADVLSLNPIALVLLIANLSLSFLRHTMRTTDPEVRNSRSPCYYVPCCTLIVKHRLASTNKEIESLEQFVLPEIATVSRESPKETKISLLLKKDQRTVRNIHPEMFRLTKLGKKQRKILNVNYVTADAEKEYLLSCWFQEVRRRIFLDSFVLASPFLVDVRLRESPTLVACRIARSADIVKIGSLVYLPAGLAHLPQCLALILHWNQTQDAPVDSSPLLPTLPFCKVNLNMMRKRQSVEMGDVVELNKSVKSFFDSLLDGCLVNDSQGRMFATASQIHRRTETIDQLAKKNKSLLSDILVKHLAACDLPESFCPVDVAAFKRGKNPSTDFGTSSSILQPGPAFFPELDSVIKNPNINSPFSFLSKLERNVTVNAVGLELFRSRGDVLRHMTVPLCHRATLISDDDCLLANALLHRRRVPLSFVVDLDSGSTAGNLLLHCVNESSHSALAVVSTQVENEALTANIAILKRRGVLAAAKVEVTFAPAVLPHATLFLHMVASHTRWTFPSSSYHSLLLFDSQADVQEAAAEFGTIVERVVTPSGRIFVLCVK